MFCLLFVFTLSGFTDTKSFTGGWSKWFDNLLSLPKGFSKITNKLGQAQQLTDLIGPFQYYDLTLLNDSLNAYMNNNLKPIINLSDIFISKFELFKNATEALADGMKPSFSELKEYLQEIKGEMNSGSIESFRDIKGSVFLGDYKKFVTSFAISYIWVIAIFLILFILSCIYNCVAQIGCLCCKLPIKANWPGVKSTVFFWVGVALYLTGAFIRITGLTTAKDYGNIFVNINETACIVTKSLGKGLLNHGNALISSLNTTLTSNVTQIMGLISDSIDGVVDEIRTWMDDLFLSIFATDSKTPEDIKDLTLVDAVNRIKLKAQQLNDAIKEVKDKHTSEPTEVKNISFAEVDEMIEKIPKWKTDGIDSFRKKAHKFVDGYSEQIVDLLTTNVPNMSNDLTDLLQSWVTDERLNGYCQQYNFSSVEKIGKMINNLFIVMFLFTFICAIVGILWMSKVFYGHGYCNCCIASCTSTKVMCGASCYCCCGSCSTLIGCVVVLFLPFCSESINFYGSVFLPKIFGSKGINIITQSYSFEIANTTIEISPYSLTYPTGRIIDTIWPADPDPNATFFGMLTSGLKTFLNSTALSNALDYTLNTIIPPVIKIMVYDILNSTVKSMVDDFIPQNMHNLTFIETQLINIYDSLQQIEDELEEEKNNALTPEEKQYIKDRINEVRVSIDCNDTIVKKCMKYSYSNVFYVSLEENVLNKIFVQDTFYVNTSHVFGQKGFRNVWNVLQQVVGNLLNDVYYRVSKGAFSTALYMRLLKEIYADYKYIIKNMNICI
ncbi:hypothetical protein TVAG_476260 [Trichomonas vaginalis G3]|uniref:Uncharacterized protein n=1 Tax=Trichomonas vaginalis (strain ATCC PRA-98 / G3) TaxID=412133 RepID=A2DA49_TRIV3|nr:hypothetical protein TVAG_476260 [Trichomonas vaginalis G3]|eukprot:XP_001583683.1 hypothetical protein [Trichomonas vaginalis G3]